MRKKKHPEHVNHERWLVSYADFITLLFAFFVVMFAVSRVDTTRMGRFTEEFSRAVGITLLPRVGAGLMPENDTSHHGESSEPTTEASEHSDVMPHELRELQAALRDIAHHSDTLQGLTVIERRHELVLRLPDSILFDSGDDRLRAPAVRALEVVAEQLRPRHIDVRVEGHTDDRPIRRGRFQSNWELSTARATAVVLSLAGQQIAPTRLSAAGYGEFRPIESNEGEAGRQANRRVDLVVTVSADDESTSPHSAPAAAGNTTAATTHVAPHSASGG